MARDIIRRVRFSPYLKGMGPRFALAIWDTGRTDHYGKSILGYRLRQDRRTLFEGEDFACSPLHAIDSDECVKVLMTFLTLRPGDTDHEYFAEYAAAQLEYCDHHAEALSAHVCDRFRGEE